MRIAQVMLGKGYGGAERSFVDLTLALAARGHELLAICQGRFRQHTALLGQPGIRVKTLRVLGTWDRFAGARIGAALADFDACVVHCHLARAAHLAGHAARRAGIPALAKTHNYVDLKYYRRIDQFVATTRDQARFLRGHGIGADRIEVIPNFSAFAPAPPRARAGPPVRLLAYGRLVHKKGFDVLLEALAALGAAPAWQLTLGGDGPERARLQALAEARGIASRVAFAGWVADIRALLVTHDLFVLPSRDEPFGIAVLEAMAAGTPIIATRTQGPREILDQASAWLVAPADRASLSAALGAALHDQGACQQRASAALALFRRDYAADAVVPRYEALYRRLAR